MDPQNSRLIIVEGLMGSGKSTVATQIALELQARNIPYRYHWEAETPHPVKTRISDGKRNFSAEELIERSLLKWHTFSAQAQKTNRIAVFDGQLFHVNVTSMLKQNGTRGQIEAYIRNVVDCIQPLHPKLVYFYQQDVEGALRKVGNQRGERWIESHIREKTENPFAEQHALAGLSGLVRFCELYRELTDYLFEMLDMGKLSVENSAADWKLYDRQVLEFLSLAPATDGLQRGNAHLNHTQDDVPSRMCIENHTARLLVLYEWPFKKRQAVYHLEILPQERRSLDLRAGQRFRIHDANTGEIIQDVIACRKDQVVKVVN